MIFGRSKHNILFTLTLTFTTCYFNFSIQLNRPQKQEYFLFRPLDIRKQFIKICLKTFTTLTLIFKKRIIFYSFIKQVLFLKSLQVMSSQFKIYCKVGNSCVQIHTQMSACIEENMCSYRLNQTGKEMLTIRILLFRSKRCWKLHNK